MLEKTTPVDTSLTPRQMRASGMQVSVILPTLNEVENICPLIDAIYSQVPNLLEILVVDDNSPDGTAEAVAEYAKRFPDRHVRVEKRRDDHGLTKSLWHGIKRASGSVVVWMDCDFSMPPEMIPSLLACIDNGYDIAVGSRFVRGGSFKRNTANTSDSALAVFLSRCMNYAIQLILDHSFKDYTSGFIAVRRDVFKEIGLQGNYGEYFIDFIFKAIRYGFRIVEIPYVCLPRLKGTSKTGQSIWQFSRLGWRYLKTAAKLRLHASFKHSLPLRPLTIQTGLAPEAHEGDVKIVPAVSSHIPLIAGLHHQVLYQTLNSRLGIPFLEDLYNGVLNDPQAKMHVALQGERLLGFVALTFDLKGTKRRVGRQLLWKDRVVAALHILTSIKDLMEFASHDLFFRYCIARRDSFATILTLGVAPHAQGTGVAQQVIERARRSFEEAGVKRYFVDTLSNNNRALAFYKKAGFRPLSTFLGNTLLEFTTP